MTKPTIWHKLHRYAEQKIKAAWMKKHHHSRRCLNCYRWDYLDGPDWNTYGKIDDRYAEIKCTSCNYWTKYDTASGIIAEAVDCYRRSDDYLNLADKLEPNFITQRVNNQITELLNNSYADKLAIIKMDHLNLGRYISTAPFIYLNYTLEQTSSIDDLAQLLTEQYRTVIQGLLDKFGDELPASHVVLCTYNWQVSPDTNFNSWWAMCSFQLTSAGTTIRVTNVTDNSIFYIKKTDDNETCGSILYKLPKILHSSHR